MELLYQLASQKVLLCNNIWQHIDPLVAFVIETGFNQWGYVITNADLNLSDINKLMSNTEGSRDATSGDD